MDNKKFVSLKKNKQFRKVYRYGSSAADHNLVIYKFKSRVYSDLLIGMSVSTKVGKAVIRNLIKRRLREICRLNLNAFQSGHHYVIVVRMAAKNRSYGELEKSFFKVIKKLNVR